MANKYDKVLGEYREADTTTETDPLSLHLDQTTPQTVTGTLTLPSLTVDTDSLFVDKVNHRVGVGTITPGALFNVNGVALIGSTSLPYVSAAYVFQVKGATHGLAVNTDLPSSSYDGLALSVGSTGEGYVRTNFYSNGQIGFGPGNATRDVFIGRTSSNTIGISGSFDGSGTGNFYVSGNVGIGTTAPVAKLDVNGDININVNNLIGTGSNQILFLEQSGYGGLIKYNATTDSFIIGTLSAGVEKNSFSMARNTGAVTIGDGGFDLNSSILYLAGVQAFHNIKYAVGGMFLTDNEGINFNLGNPATNKIKFDSNGNVGIGTTAPAQKLDVTGKIAINGTARIYIPDQTNFLGTMYLGNGDGGASLSHTTGAEGQYNTFVGIGAGNANTTGYQNTASGYISLYSNTTGHYNTAYGNATLRANTTGNNNTAFGYISLYSNTTGSSNTASGYATLYSNTEGNFNTAFGYISLYSNTTGSCNTASGYATLYSNTTGSYNTAYGVSSLQTNTTGYNNTAIGYASLFANTTGFANTAIGLQSLYSNASGSNNYAIGLQALYGNTTGNYNISLGNSAGRFISDGTTANTTGDYNLFLGANTKALADNDQNEIVIGYNATGSGTNTATIGNSNVTDLYLKNDNYKLRLGAAGDASIYYDGTNMLINPQEVGAGNLIIPGGKVGIGTTSPTAVLHLKAGTSTASTAPLKLTSGTLLETAEVGAIEFLSDDFFATITTGAARKGIILDDGSRLTSGKIPVATTNGRLVDLTAQDTEADLKVDYTSGDLDTEAEIITAINTTNAKINSIIAKLKTLGLLATS